MELKEKTKDTKQNEKKIFAKGYCFAKIFMFFIIGCLVGTYWEEVLWFFGHHYEITNRQGLIYGPFSPIYGVGFIIFIVFLERKNDERSRLKTYIYSSFIGGITEFMTSFIAEKVFGVKFWDYTGYFLNIDGRTTIPFMIFWGLAGLVLMKVIYPFISKWIEKIPYKFARVAYPIFLTFIVLDVLITYTAFGRMTLRNQGKEPYTFIGQLYDKYYTNQFMAEKFPAMDIDK